LKSFNTGIAVHLLEFILAMVLAHIEGFSFLWLVVYCLFIVFFTAVTYIVPDIVSVYYGDIENS